jgi:predicted peptidase
MGASYEERWHTCVYVDLFAAISPLCGAGNAAKAKRLKDVPVWVVHGAKDDVVPVELGVKMIKALESVKGKVHSTIYPDIGHDLSGIYLRTPL